MTKKTKAIVVNMLGIVGAVWYGLVLGFVIDGFLDNVVAAIK